MAEIVGSDGARDFYNRGMSGWRLHVTLLRASRGSRLARR